MEQMEHRKRSYPLRPEAENYHPMYKKSQGEKDCPEYKGNGSGKYGSNTAGWENAKPFWPSAGPAKPHNQFHGGSGSGVHPTKTSVCPVNDKGLPLRPDMEICPYYNRYGMCKRGIGCQFDHSVPQAKPEPAAESEEAN